MDFKPPKTLEEQIEYLKNDKRVVFNDISETEAIEILKNFGYINVISPFKFYFALKDANDNPIKKENGKHIYLRDVDFSEYYALYKKERETYPTLYKSISTFESIFNSIVAYECIHFYNIHNSEKFSDFISALKSHAESLNAEENVKTHYINSLEKINHSLDKYNSIYILMDRLTLNESFTLFKCCDKPLKKQIFRKLREANCTLNENRITNFEKKLNKVILIRNHVYHNNSLTILVRYYKIERKELRIPTERTVFKKLIEYLIETFQ